MRKMFPYLFIFVSLYLSINTANGLSFEDAFQQGIEAYRTEKFEDANQAFTKALEASGNNPSALTNLALTQYKLGNKPYAVALLRKALAIDPDLSTPRVAIEFILPQLEVKEIPHEIQTWELFRKTFLVDFPLSVFIILAAILLFASGWILITYFANRKRSIHQELPMPPFPIVGFLISSLFVFCLSLMITKWIDSQTTRGTIILQKVAVLSAPDEKAAPLFDLYGGLEVVVEKNQDSWVQVTYPGALSGWVPKDSIFITTGPN